MSSNVTPTPPNIFLVHSWNDFLALHCPVALYVERYVTPVWYVIGVVGNVIAASVWMDRRMRKSNSSAVYLATLSVTDLLFLLLHVLHYVKFAWGIRTFSYPAMCEIYFMVFLVAQYLSPLLVLGFTVERYIAVCHPFRKEEMCTPGRAGRVVAGLVITTLLLASMQAYFWTFNEVTMECALRPDAMRGGDMSIWALWTWVTEMLVFLAVPLVILMFNVCVIREVRRLSHVGQTVLAGQAKSDSGNSAVTTVMLLSVSFFTIFTTLPATVVYALAPVFHEGNAHMTDTQLSKDTIWQHYLMYQSARKIVEEVCMSHYACNFFLYMINGAHFRYLVVEKLRFRLVCGRCARTTRREYSQISLKSLDNQVTCQAKV